ncbi:MAG: CinA family nicotinamide mononucleotide deamidase-related protein [Planctomycetota bacterium]
MLGEVIAIGDELTSGERLDTNSQWLSQRLTEMGIEVRYHTTVGDDLDANIEVFRAAIARADVVVATGGLGPTADDLTRESIAAATGVELVRDDASLERIRQMFLSRGRTMPERNERQADFPHGSQPVANPNGTAPGVQMVVQRDQRNPCLLFALPGVPAEMHEMWSQTVAPTTAAAVPQPRVIRHRRLKCFGVGESHLEAMLPDLVRRGRDPRVGITVSGATITLRVTAAGPDEAAAFAAMEPTLATIREKLGILVFGAEDDELQDAVSRLLVERQQSVATAESWTGGLLAQWLASVEADIQAKVGGDYLTSPEAVEELAVSIRRETGCNFALTIGAPDQSDPPAVAISLVGEDVTVTKQYPLIGHPTIVRPRIAKLALNLLRLHLLNHDPT